MPNTAIRVEQLGKRYRVGSRSRRHDRFGEWAADCVTAPFRRAANVFRDGGQHARHVDDTTFWALKDVSFGIEHGSVTGVIGHNGAGKSTILKILSRITEPTTGHVDLYGRVSSLLEVGTGFHPDLTGRENIFLNGGILGLRGAEIRARFDSIVEFAQVAPFVDTPVKHYSSGMYVRLAFAVAAHLEPEILVVDEVLAVGDLGFQKKCLAKMDSISREGRAVLLVSHNMNIIRRLCERTVLLDHGRLTAFGPTSEVIEKYLSSSLSRAGAAAWVPISPPEGDGGTGRVRANAVSFTSLTTATGLRPFPLGPLEILIDVISDAARSVDSIAVSLFDRYGTKLVNVDTLSLGRFIRLERGHNLVRLRVDSLYLNPGIYVVGVWIANPPHELFHSIPHAAFVEVVENEDGRIRVRDDGAVPCRFDIVESRAWQGSHDSSLPVPAAVL